MWQSSGLNINLGIAPDIHRPRAKINEHKKVELIGKERKRRDVTTPSCRVVGGASETGEVFLQRSEEVANHGHTP